MRIDGSSSKYLQAIIDSLGDELMVIDRNFRIIDANSAVLSRHGKRREEVVGKYCYEVSHSSTEPCNLPFHECPVKEVWKTGKPARIMHVHTYTFKGEEQKRHIDGIASPIVDSKGDIIAVAYVMRDITETKELESRITKAHQELLTLNTIGSVVSQSLDLDTVLKSALDKTLEVMEGSIGGILLLDEERQMLCYRVHRGLSSRYAEEMCLRLGEGIAGKVAQTGEAILVDDISKDSRAAHPALIAAEGIRTFACVPLRSKEKVLGVLNIASHEAGRLSSEDIRLLDSIAAQIAIAIENAKLHQEVRLKEETRGELLQDIFSIQEEERRRIARELHDETSQALASLSANLEVAMSMLPDDAQKPKTILKRTQALSVNILDEINNIIYQLRPTLLDDLGLVAATRWLADKNLGVAGVTINFKTVGKERRLASQLEATLFRVVQEAVNNIAKHAHAKNAQISLHFKRGVVGVRIRDDGNGFDVEEAIRTKDRPRGLGLLGMKERVELVKGNLNIRSHAGGGGTEINIEIPLN